MLNLKIIFSFISRTNIKSKDTNSHIWVIFSTTWGHKETPYFLLLQNIFTMIQKLKLKDLYIMLAKFPKVLLRINMNIFQMFTIWNYFIFLSFLFSDICHLFLTYSIHAFFYFLLKFSKNETRTSLNVYIYIFKKLILLGIILISIDRFFILYERKYNETI